MVYILLCRVWILIPLCILLWGAAIWMGARWIKNKKISCKSMLSTLSIFVAVILLSYFMFLHGNLRKTTIDLEDCVSHFDTILDLPAEKQDLPYWGSETGEYYYIKKHTAGLELDVHILYGEMNPAFDCTATAKNAYEALLAPRLSRQVHLGETTCTASAMVAHTESLYGIHTFNGCYSGVIHMQREDVHIVIDYEIVRAPKWTDAFTTEKPKPITLSEVLL